jgi:hypothetical protein
MKGLHSRTEGRNTRRHPSTPSESEVSGPQSTNGNLLAADHSLSRSFHHRQNAGADRLGQSVPSLGDVGRPSNAENASGAPVSPIPPFAVSG